MYKFLQLILFIFIFNFSYTGTCQKHIQNDSIITYIKTTNDTDSLVVENIGKYLAENRYAKSTFPVLEEINHLVHQTHNSPFRAKIYQLYGNYYYYNGQPDLSEKSLLKAKNHLQKQSNPLVSASVNITLSVIHRKRGDISGAIKLLLDAKSILDDYEKTNLAPHLKKQVISDRIILNNSLANFYNQIEEFDKSLSYYDKAFENAMRLNSQGNAGIIISNKGNLLLKMNRNNEALKAFQKAKILKEIGNIPASSIANTDENIGLALLNIKQYDEALSSLDKAHQYYKKNNHLTGLMRTYEEKGRVYNALKQYQKAIKNCHKAKQIALNNNDLPIQEASSKCLATAYEATGDLDNALLNYKDYIKVHDAIFNKKNIKKIAQLEMQYQFDKEKELANIINKAKEKESKSTINLLILGLLSLLLISTLLYGLFHTRNKKNIQLKEKNTVISEALSVNQTLLKETHHRVKNNLQIISSLLNMQSRFVDDEKSKEIVTDSQNRIKSMSLIHQQLYQENNLTSIESTTYFTKLLESLIASYGIDKLKVKMRIDIESLLLDVDTAIPLGLILNELISNAFKHGIDKENGVFELQFFKKDTSTLQLIIKDNGPGIPNDFDIRKTNSYGMKLIQILGQKLKADYIFNNNNGLEIIINIHRFKIIE